MNDQTPQASGWSFPEPPKEKRAFPAGKPELLFGIICLFLALGLGNSILYGGFNLGFALFAGTGLLVSIAYLLIKGCRLNAYSCVLLGLCLLLIAGFARSSDGFVKFVCFCFLFLSANLGLCLLAGKNRWVPAGIRSLLDAPRTFFGLGFGRLPESTRGLGQALRSTGTAGKKGGAILLGLGLAVPILLLLIFLLSRADAAFEGLVKLLPEWDLRELSATLILGSGLFFVLYTRAAALAHDPAVQQQAKASKGLSSLTVNTVLGAVALVYLVYLFSQLAYFSGGFSGILPEGYTNAEYARRGFFEMAWLCSINLAIIILAAGFTARKDKLPVSTKLLCLFIGLVTLFLTVTASAKMLLYISAYGLTRLRLLTEVIMVFVGITTAIVTVWLFVPRLPYMQVVLVLALVIGAGVLWADVDTAVAHYNVRAYQSGQLQSIDVRYLNTLGDGAVPYLMELTKDPDADIAAYATKCLLSRKGNAPADFRDWNHAKGVTATVLEGFFG